MSLESTEELCLMSLKIETEFEEKLNCASKNGMRNLAIFHQTTKSQNWDFDGILLSKVKMCELKIYRENMCHDNEEWCKIWRGIDLSFQNWYEEFDNFWPKHLKISKICTLMDCFWPRHIMFELKKRTEESCLIALNSNTKFEQKMTCAFKNDMRNLVNFQQSKFESLKIGTLMGSFYPKYELKICRGIMCHSNEKWWKI